MQNVFGFNVNNDVSFRKIVEYTSEKYTTRQDVHSIYIKT